MFTRPLFVIIVLFSFYSTAFSQYVETAANHPKIIDGLYTDSQGNIYTTPGGLQGGFTIGVFKEGENYNPNFASGFNGPINIGQVHDSLLVITNFDNNTLKTYNLNSGLTTTVANGLDGPAGIAVDRFNNAYFSNFGAPPTYSGSTIYKYNAAGKLSLYIDSPLLFRPQGMAIDHHGNLYVASLTDASNNGKIYKVNPIDSTLNLFASIGTTIGNMAYRNQDSSIYFTSQNRIMKLDLAGNTSLVSGSTLGAYQDGDLSSARFQNPLGLAFSITGDTLYVSEAGGVGRLRRIVLTLPTSVADIEKEEFKVYPSPAKEQITIDFGKPILAQNSLSIFSSAGILIRKSQIPFGESTQILPIDDLSDGLYWLVVETDKSPIYSNKFIKIE